MNKTIKIQTPNGKKNWDFVKKCIENHDELVSACEMALDYFNDPESFEGGSPWKVLEQVLQKAKVE